MRALGIILGFIVAALAAYLIWGLFVSDAAAATPEETARTTALRKAAQAAAATLGKKTTFQTRSGAGHF